MSVAAPTASDLVNRDFARDEPNRLWLTDITEHRTMEGKVYCAVVLDAFSRRVVGWSIASACSARSSTNSATHPPPRFKQADRAKPGAHLSLHEPRAGSPRTGVGAGVALDRDKWGLR